MYVSVCAFVQMFVFVCVCVWCNNLLYFLMIILLYHF